MCIYSCKIKIKIKNRALVTAQQRDLCDQPSKHKACDGEGKEERCKNLASPSDQEMPSKTCWMISSRVSYFSWGWCEKAGLAAQREEQRPRTQASMCAYCMDNAPSIWSQAELQPVSHRWRVSRGAAGLSVSEVDCSSHWQKPIHQIAISMNSSISSVFIPSHCAGNKSWDPVFVLLDISQQSNKDIGQGK